MFLQLKCDDDLAGAISSEESSSSDASSNEDEKYENQNIQQADTTNTVATTRSPVAEGLAEELAQQDVEDGYETSGGGGLDSSIDNEENANPTNVVATQQGEGTTQQAADTYKCDDDEAGVVSSDNATVSSDAGTENSSISVRTPSSDDDNKQDFSSFQDGEMSSGEAMQTALAMSESHNLSMSPDTAARKAYDGDSDNGDAESDRDEHSAGSANSQSRFVRKSRRVGDDAFSDNEDSSAASGQSDQYHYSDDGQGSPERSISDEDSAQNDDSSPAVQHSDDAASISDSRESVEEDQIVAQQESQKDKVTIPTSTIDDNPNFLYDSVWDMIHKPYYRKSLLEKAIANNNVEIVKLLLCYGADSRGLSTLNANDAQEGGADYEMKMMMSRRDNISNLSTYTLPFRLLAQQQTPSWWADNSPMFVQ